jgi:hypothetical protein
MIKVSEISAAVQQAANYFLTMDGGFERLVSLIKISRSHLDIVERELERVF